jgi:hypothetical protein
LETIRSDISKDVTISVDIIGKKDSPYNGYVDCIANLFHRMDSEKMAKTSWMSHCLLRPNDEVLERALMLYSGEGTLNSDDWYQMVTQLSGRDSTGISSSILDQIGALTKEQPNWWENYLNEVERRMASKNYTLNDLAAALNWLNRWQPEGQAIPLRLQLQWHSARLATANHFGEIETESQRQCETIGERLMDEAVQEVCEADLRCAVAFTNAFRFKDARLAMQRISKVSEQALGLKLAGKRLSQLGQIAAFTNNYKAALDYFCKANATFEKLSDRKEAEREQKQTGNYLLCVLLDKSDGGSREVAEFLIKYFTQLHGQFWINKIINSEDMCRYDHLLMTRACALNP